jgi:hypothetical protein
MRNGVVNAQSQRPPLASRVEHEARPELPPRAERRSGLLDRFCSARWLAAVRWSMLFVLLITSWDNNDVFLVG